MRRAAASEDGFTLLEVVVGMLILTVGLLAMAGATGTVFTQLRSSQARSHRMAAVEYATEQLKAAPFDSVDDRCSALSEQVGRYAMSCVASAVNGNLMNLQVISRGPGFRSGGWNGNVADTFEIRVAR